MSFFEEGRWREDPEHRLTPEEADYYRRVLAAHRNDPKTGACAVCRVAGCADYRNAFDRLAEAGELMDQQAGDQA